MGMRLAAFDRSALSYLIREAIIFLLLSYVILLGGTFNGLVRLDIRLLTAVLFTLFVGIWILRRTIKGLSFPASGFDLPIAIYLGAVLIGTLASQDPRRSLIYFLQVLIFFCVSS